MNKKKNYIIAIAVTMLVILSSLGQVFATPGKFVGDEVYITLKDKYEWEYVTDTKLEDYLTKGLIFENHKAKNGYDMSLYIPSTDSFGGVIEAFTVMLDSEDEAIKLHLDTINNNDDFIDNYGNRKVEVIYSKNGDTKIIMHSIRENYLKSLGIK